MTTVLPPYPAPVADLLPMARELATRLDQIPARNRLMREFRIGAPKASELREQLAAEYVADMLATDTDEPAGSDADPWAYAEPAGPDLPASAPTSEPVRALAPAPAPEPKPQATTGGHPDTAIEPEVVADDPAPTKRPASWPILLLALPAFVAVWSGWVGLGRLTGFGLVDLLPGIVPAGSWATLDTAITLPIGVEAYAAYALRVWLSGRVPDRARRFARWSAIGSLALGAAGQVAYHLMVAAGMTAAPWQITALVACLPVAVLGMGAALAHLVRA